MIPFSLHCTTCQAALRVTNRAAIGQILPCPKCGSMVQIVPPLLAASASTASTAANHEATAAPSIASAGEAVSIRAANPIDEIAIEAADLVFDRPPPATPPPIPWSPSATSLTDVATTAVPRGALWAWVAGGIVAVAIVAAGGWVYFFNAGPAPIVAQPNRPPSATGDNRGDAAAVESDKAAEEPLADQKLGQLSKPAEPSPVPSPAENSTADVAAPVDNAASQKSAALVPGTNDEGQPANLDESSASRSPAGAEPQTPAGDERLAHKPSLVLEDLPKSLLQANSPAAVLSTVTEPSTEPLNPAAQSDLNQDVLPDVPPQAAEPLVEPEPQSRKPLRRIAPTTIDLPARLATNIAGVAFRDAPLHQALETISGLAGVTISLDVDALYAAGIGIGEPVTVRGTSLTVAAVLEQALRPIGLAAREEHGQLLVGPASAGQTRKSRYAVNDLVRSTDPPIEALANNVRALIVGQAGSPDQQATDLSVATGEILLSAAEIEHDRMIELCEKLRVARGRPLRSRFSAERPDARFDPQRFELTTRRTRAQAVLARRITAGIGRPAPLCDVLAYLAEQAETTILVDGPALAAAGLAVQTEARLVAMDESLEAALERLLEPLGLVYRAVDDRVLEITSPAATAEHSIIEFYPVRGLFQGQTATGDDLESYREKLFAAAGVESTSAVIVLDPPSQCLIISAAYPQQVRLERALRKLDRP